MNNQNSQSTTKFWLEDPKVFLQNGNYYKIIPSCQMSKNEVLNALTLFLIYLGILSIVLTCSTKYLYLALIGIIIIILIYYLQDKHLAKETFENDNDEGEYDVSEDEDIDPSNPFGNVTMANIMNIPEDDPIVLNNDTNDDILGDKKVQRQFYTLPAKTIPNDQTGFAKWLYETPQTCKENTMNCLRYEDVRYSRSNPDLDKFAQY